MNGIVYEVPGSGAGTLPRGFTRGEWSARDRDRGIRGAPPLPAPVGGSPAAGTLGASRAGDTARNLFPPALEATDERRDSDR